jgi:hypothetical protein
VIYLPSLSGAGQFRFQDGSALKVTLVQGGDCIDVADLVGHCRLILKTAGGTGRFQTAPGVLTYTGTARPLLADALNNRCFFPKPGRLRNDFRTGY